ncbi:MAG: HNH endonuclease [Methanothrix sp.]
MDEAVLKEKLAAAKKDLNEWEKLNEILGESKPGQPDYHPWASCLLYGRKSNKLQEGRVYCKNEKYGKCVFFDNCCNNDNCMPKWRVHHRLVHPNEYRRYVLCNECKRIQKLVAESMANGISDLKNELNKPNKTRDLNDIARKLIEMPKDTNSSIESTIDADLDSILAEEEKEDLFEGIKGQRFINFYERNKKLRKKAIAIHGFKCMACDFDFKQRYGARGENFIEVHHLKPVSTLEKETNVDPKTEMAVVCSNCHRMIHRKKDEVLSLDELRKIIR